MEMRERDHIYIQQVMVISLEHRLQFALFVCLSLQCLMLLHKRLSCKRLMMNRFTGCLNNSGFLNSCCWICKVKHKESTGLLDSQSNSCSLLLSWWVCASRFGHQCVNVFLMMSMSCDSEITHSESVGWPWWWGNLNRPPSVCVWRCWDRNLQHYTGNRRVDNLSTKP